MTNCKICGSVLPELAEITSYDYLIKQGNSTPFQVFYCKKCHIATTYPEISDSELKNYYPSTFEAFKHRKGFLQLLTAFKHNNEIKWFKKKLSSGAEIFEIGAGRGEFLDRLKKQGFTVSGTEPSENGRNQCYESYNILLESPSAEKTVFTKQWDAIIMRHVLEHTSDPVKVLTTIYSGLKNNGILFIKIPKYNSWEKRYYKNYWHGLDLPRHRFHFTNQGIELLLKQIGYTNILISNERIPTDILRSLNNKCTDHVNLFCYLPKSIKLLVSIIISLFIKQNSLGRMIIVCRKP